MNAIGAIFTSLFFVFSSGYAVKKIHDEVRMMTLTRIHRGMPSLSKFTSQLTCSKISTSGRLAPVKCNRR